MAETKHVQTNFTAGEVSPRMFGRADVAKYQNGAELVENFYIQEHGGLVRRSGTKYVADVRTPANMGRLIPFQYSTTQHYIIEIADGCIRFYKNRDILSKSVATTGGSWSSGSGGRVTLTIGGGHQWKVGAKVTIADVSLAGITWPTLNCSWSLPTRSPTHLDLILGHTPTQARWPVITRSARRGRSPMSSR